MVVREEVILALPKVVTNMPEVALDSFRRARSEWAKDENSGKHVQFETTLRRHEAGFDRK
jgi:hypothetical protein